MSALKDQQGGDHYRKYEIQPVEYSHRNGLGFCAGNVVKYITRYREKGGAEDIKKIIHYCQLILEFEYPPNTSVENLERKYLLSPQVAESTQAAVDSGYNDKLNAACGLGRALK